jgi:anti-sigma factor RsiW
MTRSCEAVRVELPAYARRQLGSAESALVERHLAECRDCGEELRQLERLESLLGAHWPTVRPSPDLLSRFANRLAAEVASEADSRRFGSLSWLLRPWLVPLAAAAALAAVVAGRSLVSSPPALELARPAARPAPGKPAAAGSLREPSTASGDSTVEVASPPEEVLERLDLFVDFAVIEKLDALEGREGTG